MSVPTAAIQTICGRYEAAAQYSCMAEIQSHSWLWKT